MKVVTSQAFKMVDPVAYIGTNIQALTGSALKDAVTSDVEVACEAVGKWNQDKSSLENAEPRAVSADDGDYYEHSENGIYKYFSRTYRARPQGPSSWMRMIRTLPDMIMMRMRVNRTSSSTMTTPRMRMIRTSLSMMIKTPRIQQRRCYNPLRLYWV